MFQEFGIGIDMNRASIITIVRIPFVNKFESQMDLPCKREPESQYELEIDTNTVWVSHIVLCSNIETGIGCFASSIPSLRHIFQRELNNSSNNTRNRHVSSGSKFLTAGDISRQPRRGSSFCNPTDIGFSLSTVHHGRNEDTWERLPDESSDKSDAPINLKSIYAKRSYAIDVESA